MRLKPNLLEGLKASWSATERREAGKQSSLAVTLVLRMTLLNRLNKQSPLVVSQHYSK